MDSVRYFEAMQILHGTTVLDPACVQSKSETAMEECYGNKETKKRRIMATKGRVIGTKGRIKATKRRVSKNLILSICQN